MNIVLGTDDNYAMPCSVCITSIFENNKDILCNIYILTEGLNEFNINLFNKISKKYNRTISIVKINNNRFKELMIRGRFTKAMYNRFLIPEILNEQDTALYIDCDIIINGTISFFEKLSLKSYACAVIKDQMCYNKKFFNQRLEINTPYFNSGVIFMNLSYWRKHNLTQKCIDFIINNPNLCFYPDQDALNKVLSGQVLYIPLTYNFQEMLYIEKNYKYYDKDMLKEIRLYKLNPIIIHYTNDIKPWYKECTHPLKHLFLQYFYLNFDNVTLKKYYTISRRYTITKDFFKRINSFIKRKLNPQSYIFI